MSPYARQTVTEADHAWWMEISAHSATVAAQALAKGTMRLGQAHRYMIAAHLAALFEGAGDEAALEFVEQVAADLTGGQRNG